MNHTWSVFSYEFRRNLLRKGYLFTTLGIPLLGIIIFLGYQFLFAGGSDDGDIMQDLEFNLRGIELAGYVDESGLFAEPGELAADVMVPFSDEESAMAAMASGEIDVYYIIGTDYLETGDVRLVAPRFEPGLLTSMPVQQLLYSQWIDEVDLATLQRLLNPANIERIEFARSAEDGGARNEDADFVLVYGFALIFMLALFGTNGYLMQSVIEEKETRLIEILVSTVRPIQLLTGKILALGLLGILQIAAWLAGVFLLTWLAGNMTGMDQTFLSNIEIPWGQLPLLTVYFILGYAVAAAGFGAVGALSSSLSEGPNIALIFTMPMLGPMFFLASFLNDANGTLPVVLSLFPLSAPMAMVMRLSVIEVPLWQIGLSIALLVLTVAFTFWLAGRLFRAQTLLAGQRPKLREIPALIRG